MLERIVTQKNGKQHTVMLDDNSPARELPLSMGAAGYIRVTVKKGEQRYLAPWLMGMPDAEVDHIDKNKCNNQTNNFRLVSRRQNMWNRGRRSDNRSGMIGVNKRGCRFLARIVLGNGKRVSLGTFATAEEAGHAYDVACLEIRQEFAVVNTY